MKLGERMESGFVPHLLDLEEKIRLNRLVQRTVDIGRFRDWMTELSEVERVALICSLFRHAGDYFSKEDWSEVGDNPVAAAFLDLRDGEDWMVPEPKLFAWLEGLDEDHRDAALRLAATMLGVKEARRRADCGDNCYHWWHRDLSDPRVVDDILRKAGRKPIG